MAYQTHRYIRDTPFPAEAYSAAKPQPPLSKYHVIPSDYGDEEEPLNPDFSLRPRAWLKNRKRQRNHASTPSMKP